MAQQFFITATGTEIGKTFYLQQVAQQYRNKQKKLSIIKPIISGFDFGDKNNDSALLLQAMGLKNNMDNIKKISPWRFCQPVSPNIAANIENKEINFDALVAFCQDNILESQRVGIDLFIEGAGGIMAPITDNKTFLDLLKILEIPVILLSKNYLGTISHSLTALEVLRLNKVMVEKIILNNYEIDHDNKQDNLKNLQNFTDIIIETM